MKKLTEEELINGLRAQNARAFNYMIDNYSEALSNIVSKIVKSEELTNEILQDAFLKVWGSIHQYNASKGRFFTWVLNIARNRSIDILRSRAYKNSLLHSSIENEYYDVNTEYSQFETIGINDSLGRLNSEHQKMVGLHFYQGYSHREIAAQYGIPLGTVKSRLRTAILEMRKYFRADLSV